MSTVAILCKGKMKTAVRKRKSLLLRLFLLYLNFITVMCVMSCNYLSSLLFQVSSRSFLESHL